MKNKTSVKMSQGNLEFWKKMNVNAIKTGELMDLLSYSDLQEVVVNYFKLNNENYLELIKLIGIMEKQKHGNS